MATATEGYAYSGSSSMSLQPRSPDTASRIYPDRAIRPLPKSRLKEKLSPQQQRSIQYPPAPPPISPALHFSPGGGGHENGLAQANGDGMGRVGREETGRRHQHQRHQHHQEHERDGSEEGVAVHGHCTCRHDADGDDSGAGSGDEEAEFDEAEYRYEAAHTTTPAAALANGRPLDSVQRRRLEASRAPPPPGSVASSADGYESFENSSNKKKRKIPLSAAASVGPMHASRLSSEMASMGIGQTDGSKDHTSVHAPGHSPHLPPPSPYAASSASATGGSGSGTGISGAGRGRYGRDRRPMSAIAGYNPRLPPARNGGGDVRDGAGPSSPAQQDTTGIISRAIKTAAQQGPLTPQRGKENISLLQQSAAASASSAGGSTTTPKTQFTFTRESDSATKMLEHEAAATAAQQSLDRAYARASGAGGSYVPGTGVYGQTPYSAGGGAGYAPAAAGYTHGTATPAPPGARGAANGQALPGGMATQGTQTTPSLPSNGRANQRAPAPPNTALPPNPQPPGHATQPAPPAPKPKPRRRPSKEYALAARQRRLQQEYQNYHRLPKASSGSGWGAGATTSGRDGGEEMWICEFCEYESIFGEPPYALIRQFEIKDRQERKKAAEKRRLLEKAKMRNQKKKSKGSKGKNAAAAAAATNPAPPATAAASSAQHAAYDPKFPDEPNHLLPPGAEGEEEYYDDDEEGEGEYLEGEYADYDASEPDPGNPNDPHRGKGQGYFVPALSPQPAGAGGGGGGKAR